MKMHPQWHKDFHGGAVDNASARGVIGPDAANVVRLAHPRSGTATNTVRRLIGFKATSKFASDKSKSRKSIDISQLTALTGTISHAVS
jgi:hypothetical protein